MREVTLIGQNVNAYHGPGPDGAEWTLARLIARVAGIAGVARLRYTTSHPGDLDDALIAAHRDIPALMPCLHLPVQSGSDGVLAAMNRRHSRADYLELVARLRAARPDLALTSDFIVGFPGESDDDFRKTVTLVEQIGFAGAFSFKYSARPGTPAASAAGQVPEDIKAGRLRELQALIEHQQAAFNARTLGTTFVRFAEDRRDRAWLEAVDQNEKALPRLREGRRPAGDKNGRSCTHGIDVESRFGRVAQGVRDRLAGERPTMDRWFVRPNWPGKPRRRRA